MHSTATARIALSDEQLMARVQADDDRAFEVLYDRYHDRAWRASLSASAAKATVRTASSRTPSSPHGASAGDIALAETPRTHGRCISYIAAQPTRIRPSS